MPESSHRIRTGELPHGRRNSIADVSGVTVGHATVDRGDVHTGVTVVVPCEGARHCEEARRRGARAQRLWQDLWSGAGR